MCPDAGIAADGPYRHGGATHQRRFRSRGHRIRGHIDRRPLRGTNDASANNDVSCHNGSANNDVSCHNGSANNDVSCHNGSANNDVPCHGARDRFPSHDRLR